MGNFFSNDRQPQSQPPPQPLINPYETLILDYRQDIRELKKQNKSLMKMNEDLRKDLKKLMNPDRSGVNIPPNRQVSMEVIRQYISDMLENEDCNIEYLPDFVERRLYEKIFSMLMGLMEHTLETTSVNFMGHQIRCYVTRDTNAFINNTSNDNTSYPHTNIGVTDDKN